VVENAKSKSAFSIVRRVGSFPSWMNLPVTNRCVWSFATKNCIAFTAASRVAVVVPKDCSGGFAVVEPSSISGSLVFRLTLTSALGSVFPLR
jgi:hypothetical protein